MKITSFCLRRPITTLMFFLGILLLGIISWYFLPQELFPPLTYPVITVLTTYEGASPYEIESLITRPLEEVVGTISGVKSVSSISKEGTSIVMVEFNWGTNMDFASLNVREKIDLKKASLPREAKEPLIMKYNPFQAPTMRINLIGDIPPLKLRNLAEDNIKEELEKIEGVGSVEIVGGGQREILVEVVEARLRAASLSILDISKSLKNTNLNYPAGRIEKSFFELLLRTIGEFKKVEEIEKLPIKAEYPISELRQLILEKEGERKETGSPTTERLIFLKDVAKVKDTTKERESISRYQGKECVTLLIRRQSQANTVKLSQKLRERLKKIEKKLPPQVSLKIVHDEAEFIKKSLADVKNSAIMGGALAFLVILFFLRKFWFSVVIIFSIPLCILIVFILMYLSKMNLNIISLGGLTLGVGMMVDNAIVVLESIFSHSSPDLKKRTIEGTKEVGGAIFGSTLTTVCVFLPMIFVVGIAGQLFKQLSFAVIFSLISSLIIALSLIPTLIFIRKIYGVKKEEVHLRFWESIFSFFFKHRILTIICVSLLFFISIKIFISLDREFLPRADHHAFTLKIDAPAGTSLEETDKIVKEIETLFLKEMPEIKEVSINIGSSSEKPEEKAIQSQGPHQAQIFVNLNQEFPTKEVIEKLRKKLNYWKERDVSLNFITQESFLKEIFTQEAPLVLEIKGNKIEKLKNIGKILEEKLKNLPYLYNIKLDVPAPRPEIKTEVLKDKTILYSINTQIIAETLKASIKGEVPTKFKEEGKEYDIRVRLRKKDRDDIEKLKRLLIHGVFQDKKIDVPLMEVAEVKKGVGPIEIKRREAQRCILLSASIYKKPLSEVVEVINRIKKKIKLPPGYEINISGEGKKMAESFNSLRFALILSLVLVFMILASEFESLWQPFVIFTTAPLSLIGVSSILFFTKTPLNIVSFLGLIMLGGIVVNNGIVLVDYINFLRRERKLNLEEALKIASLRRIRPILMTSLTTILGLLPLSLGIGEAQLMQSLGMVAIGGLFSSTFLTPLVLPIIYYYFEKFFTLFRKIAVVEKKVTSDESTKTAQQEEEIEPTLSSRQRELLEYLKIHKKITRAQYAKIFNISIPTAARDLKELIEQGLVKAEGPLGPGRYYTLKEK